MRAALTACLAALLCISAAAAPEGELQGWQVQFENDVLAVGKTDRWYTNGIRGSWSWERTVTSTPGQLLRSAGRWFLFEGADPTLTYSIGQTMYTPRDITLASPQPYDRPWAAYLFGSVTAHAYAERWFAATELKLGTTGHGAAGRWVQSTVHEQLTHSAAPQGWHQQVQARLGVQLTHVRLLRLGTNPEGRDRFAFQLSGGGALGTLRNYAQFSVATFFGQLREGASPMPIPNEGDFVVQDFDNRAQFKQLYAFAAVGVDAVAYNYLLQGRTPYGRPQLDVKPLVGVLHFGINLPLQAWLDSRRMPRVLFTQTIRGPEFRSRDPKLAPERSRFGALQLVWDLK